MSNQFHAACNDKISRKYRQHKSIDNYLMYKVYEQQNRSNYLQQNLISVNVNRPFFMTSSAEKQFNVMSHGSILATIHNASRCWANQISCNIICIANAAKTSALSQKLVL